MGGEEKDVLCEGRLPVLSIVVVVVGESDAASTVATDTFEDRVVHACMRLCKHAATPR